MKKIQVPAGHFFKPYLVLGVLIVALGVILFATGVLPSHRSSSTIPSSASSRSAEDTDNAAPKGVSNGSQATQYPESPKHTTPPASGNGGSPSLVSPTGSFVSNHSPGQNGSPTTEQSFCYTTPGAICVIEFVKDGETKKLSPQTVDGSGATSWTWDVKDAGFSQGSWIIRAVATSGGQSKTTVDPLKLEVNP